MAEEGTRYLGKYRGSVVNNVDPLQKGRIQVMVPNVLPPGPSSWAMPCLPSAGIQAGVWTVPPVGTGVWVEFEQGDIDYPIWTGCWWGSAAEVPALALAAPPGAPNILLQTVGQNTFLMSDLPGGPGITLKGRTGAMIVVNDAGIMITNGQGAMITLVGPTVAINQTALVIT
jgi:uncharacterized protein involved in type VI secretion and phage assembly